MTWTVVVLENLLLALVPLLVGLTIDGLLAGELRNLGVMVAVLLVLGGVAVARRLYDTRVFGAIRLHLGTELQRRAPTLQVTKRTVRIDLSRELVDFLEVQVPDLIMAVVQITVSLAVLTWFDMRLGLACLLVIAGMLVVYACFHRSFFHINGLLNDQKERQIEVLAAGGRLGVFRHLKALRSHEIAISDKEALLYGSIFLLQVAFVAFNLYQGGRIAEITAGQFFSIAAYSWDYVEAALLLPLALQSWSRLSEICGRLNRQDDEAPDMPSPNSPSP